MPYLSAIGGVIPYCFGYARNRFRLYVSDKGSQRSYERAMISYRGSYKEALVPHTGMMAAVHSSALGTHWHILAHARPKQQKQVRQNNYLTCYFLVPPGGFEPSTPALGEQCSIP